MHLESKKHSHVIPSYSLTGDLLSFLRCGLQYRYHNGSSLPPSRPVQLWFGEFVHGVMESAYRLWHSSDHELTFPWPCNPTSYLEPLPPQQVAHDIGTIGHLVEETLRSQGKRSRSQATRESAYRRSAAAVNEVGPHLFPLVASAEEHVIGTRRVPSTQGGGLRADRYELHGVIDVLTDVQLSMVPEGNVIRDAIVEVYPDELPEHFEVVVDYKGSRRPPINHGYWAQAEWQVQTYAWLRMRQPNSLPVVGGVLIYVNELAPGPSDILDLKHEIRQRTTDVIPVSGTSDAYELSVWRQSNKVPNFSQSFRMKRAIRAIQVTSASIANATGQFDGVVLQIEKCVAAEAATGTIRNNWTTVGDEATCAACDFRHFCPSPAPRSPLESHEPVAPAAP